MVDFDLEFKGLDKYRQGLDRISKKIPDAVLAAFAEAGDIIADTARPKVPRRTGAAQRSLRSTPSPRGVRVVGGSSSVRYYAWLEYGGRAGRNGSVVREYVPQGRYIYPTYVSKRNDVERVLLNHVIRLFEQEGLKVT